MAGTPNYWDYQAYTSGLMPPIKGGPGAADIARAQIQGSQQRYLNVGAQALNEFFPESNPQKELLDEYARRQLERLQSQQGSKAPGGAAAAVPATGAGTLGDWFGGMFGGGGAATQTGAGQALTSAGGAGPMSMADGTAILADGTIGTAEGALGTASTGLSGMGSLGTGTLGTGLTAGGLATVLGGLGAAGYGGYKLADRNKWDDKNEWEYSTRNGAITGAGLGTAIMPGVGTAIGAGLGGLTGFLGAQFGGGKHKDQRKRDDMRKSLKGAGLIDDAYNLTLADGGKYNIGRDGSVKNYNVDFGQEGIGDTVGALNPLAMIVSGGGGKGRSDLAGYYTNAARSSGDSSSNVKKFYSDAGLDHDSAYGLVHQMQQEGRISKEDGDAAKNALDQTYGVGAYAGKKAVNKPSSVPVSGGSLPKSELEKLKPWLKSAKG